MPLRDHFRPPTSLKQSWDALHGMWPGVIVQHLRKQLPPGYVAAPSVHLGSLFEVDIATFENDFAPRLTSPSDDDGSVATALLAPPTPAIAIETDLPTDEEYRVLIYDVERGRQLVATIEIVSPANKDRPESRNAFVGKCAALLKAGVAVSIIDLVTVRPINLFGEVMEFIGQRRILGSNPLPPLYAVSARWTSQVKKATLEAWPRAMTIGEALPTIPLCLNPEMSILLDLNVSYEQACHDLWIS